MYGDLCRTGKGISMRNERKERNQQVEQRLLQDIEVFSSPQFLRLISWTEESSQHCTKQWFLLCYIRAAGA